MPMVKLMAAGGAVLHEVEAEKWATVPDVVLWGQRAFVRVPGAEPPLYQEGSLWVGHPGDVLRPITAVGAMAESKLTADSEVKG